MALTFAQFKEKLVGLFGEDNDSSQTMDATVGRAMERIVVVPFNPFPSLTTASISLPVADPASQPIRERVVHYCPHKGKLKSAFFSLNYSSTVTATATQSWHLVIRKRGGSFASASDTNTYSLTRLIAALTSVTDGANSRSGSYSALGSNTVAHYPNRCHLGKGAGFANGDAVKTDVGKGDIITAAVLKGSGTATDAGAVWGGGTLTLVFEED